MNTLITVLLIKSAKFEYSKIDVDGNTLLVGSNGAGKTTILRAILYFYTANARALGINSAKKQNFIDFYLEYANSYIAYIYKKENKYVLVVVYKTSSVYIKMCMFNQIPHLEEIFVNKDRLLEPQEVWLKLKAQGIMISNALKPNEYLKTLYGKSLNKEFSLFLSRDYYGFVKTLSNIFINSKVDSNTIKNVLTSSLNSQNNIDLARIKRHLDGFNKVYEDIQKYQKQISTIEKIIKKFQELDDTSKELSMYISICSFSKEQTRDKIVTLSNRIKDISNHLLEHTVRLEKEKKLFEGRSQKRIENIGVLKSKLKEIEKLEAYYKEQNVKTKIKQYAQLDMLLLHLNEFQAQKEFLTKKVDELQHSHNNTLMQIENSFIANQNILTKVLFQEKEKLKDKEHQVKNKQQQEIDSIKQSFSIKEDELKAQKMVLELELKDISYSIKNRQQSIFIFENDNTLSSLRIKVVDISQKIIEYRNKIDLASHKFDNLQATYEMKEKNITDRYKTDKTQLKKKLEKIKLQKNPKPNSLLEQIYNQGFNSSKYLYFLKDDVLQESFDIGFIKSSNDIFDVKFLNLQVKQDDIQVKLEMIQKEIKTKEHYYQQSLQKLELEFVQEEKILTKEKKRFNEVKKELEKEEVSTKTRIKQLVIQKDEQHTLFEKSKQRKVEQLQVQKQEILSNIEIIKEKLKELEKLKNSKITSIKIYYTKELNQLKEMINFLEHKYYQDIRELETTKKKQIEIQKENYYEMLKKEGIDTSKVKEYEDKILLLTKEIENIKLYEKLIFGYEKDTQKLQNKKLYKKELKEIQQKLKELEDNHKAEEKVLLETIDTLKKEILNLEYEERDIQRSLDEFEEFQKGNIFINVKQRVVKFQEIQEFLELSYIKEQITILDSIYTTYFNTISALINKISDIFDTSLEIKREIDPLQSAQNLQDFYLNDKIEQYKKLLSDNLNQIVQNLIQEYQKLLSQTQKIQKLISKINRLFDEIQISVIDELDLRYSKTDNKSLEILEQIKLLNDESIGGFGLSLFSAKDDSSKMIKLLRVLSLEIENSGYESISLEDSFVLEFRVVENGNDSKYQVSLDNIGSNGTDVLVKSMIYISMVHIFKTQISKKELRVHVILDEIGILSQKYLKALIEFANRYGIVFVNGAPDEKLIGTYKRVYLIKRDNQKAKSLKIINALS